MERWKAETVLGTVILVLGLQIACGGDSPAAPTPTRGITIYQHPDFGGEHYEVVENERDLASRLGPCGTIVAPGAPPRNSWADCISSLKVAEGWTATAFERDDYAGQELPITADILDLDDVSGPCGGNWDDCIASIRVSPPG